MSRFAATKFIGRCHASKPCAEFTNLHIVPLIGSCTALHIQSDCVCYLQARKQLEQEIRYACGWQLQRDMVRARRNRGLYAGGVEAVLALVTLRMDMVESKSIQDACSGKCILENGCVRLVLHPCALDTSSGDVQGTPLQSLVMRHLQVLIGLRMPAGRSHNLSAAHSDLAVAQRRVGGRVGRADGILVLQQFGSLGNCFR